jgi:iron complex outermembrane recepter protein
MSAAKPITLETTAHEKTPGRSQVFSSPSGGLAQSDGSGGAHEKTPGRSQIFSSPSGGLAQSDGSGGANPQTLGIALYVFACLVLLGLAPCHAQTLERVEVTGSAIKQLLNSAKATPVTTITRAQIERSGAANTEELLQNVPALSSAGAVATSAGVGAASYGLSALSMRGLSSARTLVLVNGRRLAPFAGGSGTEVANINAIPLAAIERVEVLKEGASALYGSDAIAGVVNFILKRGSKGFELGFDTGSPTQSGGGQTHRISALAGFGDWAHDQFQISLAASYESEKPLFARDRDFARTGVQPPYLVVGSTGQGNIEGAYTPGERDAAGVFIPGKPQNGFGNNQGEGYGNPLAAQGRCAQLHMISAENASDKGAPYCAYDSQADVGLTPKRQGVYLSANMDWKITPNAQLFGDVLFSRNEVTQRYQPSPLGYGFLQSNSQMQALGIDPALWIKPDNPHYALAADYLRSKGFNELIGQPLAITSRPFDQGLRTDHDTTTQTRLVLGVKGEVKDQEYELSYTHGFNQVDGAVTDGYFSQSAYVRAIQNSSVWNPWSLQQDPSLVKELSKSKYIGATLNGLSRQRILEGRLSGDIAELSGGAAQYALGFQLRHENSSIQPSDALLLGDISGLSGAVLPMNVGRRVQAFYGELNLPLSKTLQTSLASRWDRYSDVGHAQTYQAGARWRFHPQWLVRASHGTGFRAPTLLDLHDPQVLGISGQFTDPLFPDNPGIQAPQLSGGDLNLKPESSRQASLGFVVSPQPTWSLSLDWWNLELGNVISTPSPQAVVSGYRRGDPHYASMVNVDSKGRVQDIRTTTVNAGYASLSGLDIDLNYRKRFDFGVVTLNWAGTYMHQFDQMSPDGVVSHKVGTMVDEEGNPVLGADDGGVVLRWKHNLGLTLQRGSWSWSAIQNFYTGYETGRRQSDNERNFVSDQSIYDIHGSYSGFQKTKIAWGIKNIFNTRPSMFIPVSNQFQAGYDITQYDPRGRMIYFLINHRF